MSTIGRVLGDLLPATRKARAALTKLHHADPPKIAATHVAEIASGRILGFQAAEDGPVVFRGVPFATAGRLEKPQPVEPWKGERSCLRFGPACPQPAFGLRMMTRAESPAAAVIENLFPPLPPDQSYWYGSMREEECLNANVYTPSLDGKRPVLVWIHGGGFTLGSNIEGGFYAASGLAGKADAVVISINYRVGPFGFLHFPDKGITNLALRDQIAALEWVRDNISNFGGDPGNVTIIGESAGGCCVSTLAGSPKARGLFHRAVAMSGATNFGHTPDTWSQFASCIEDALKKHTGGPLTHEAACQLKPQQLTEFMLKALWKPINKPLGTDSVIWQPLRDGDVVPFDGAHSNLAGAPPILTGVADDECKMMEAFMPSPKTKEKAIEKSIATLRGYFHRTNRDEVPADTELWKKYSSRLYELVEASRAERGLLVAPQDVSRGMQNLLYFEEGSYCLARDAGGFAYNLHFMDDSHGVDIPLLFRFPFGKGSSSGPPSEEDVSRADQFLGMVMSFARTGTPKVADLSWKPSSEVMHLLPEPETRGFKGEILGFQSLKRDIVSELGISTPVPHNLAS